MRSNGIQSFPATCIRMSFEFCYEAVETKLGPSIKYCLFISQHEGGLSHQYGFRISRYLSCLVAHLLSFMCKVCRLLFRFMSWVLYVMRCNQASEKTQPRCMQCILRCALHISIQISKSWKWYMSPVLPIHRAKIRLPSIMPDIFLYLEYFPACQWKRRGVGEREACCMYNISTELTFYASFPSVCNLASCHSNDLLSCCKKGRDLELVGIWIRIFPAGFDTRLRDWSYRSWYGFTVVDICTCMYV